MEESACVKLLQRFPGTLHDLVHISDGRRDGGATHSQYLSLFTGATRARVGEVASAGTRNVGFDVNRALLQLLCCVLLASISQSGSGSPAILARAGP
jgi:hypothetical protein